MKGEVTGSTCDAVLLGKSVVVIIGFSELEVGEEAKRYISHRKIVGKFDLST